MAEKRLLLALAHPDDESFGYGGLVARYVAAGVDVYLLVSTNGDAGTVDPEYLEQYGSVTAVRLAELDCAADVLGFKQVFRLGYKDSGMMHSATSQDPACSWQAPREELARKVTEVIRQVQPQVVLTFNKYGGYGHPDHIAIQRATTDAFYLAGDADFVTPGFEPYHPQKLYYSSPARFWLSLRITQMYLKGQDPRRMGRNQDIDLVAILDHIESTTTRVNVGAYLDVWDTASACHASQLSGGWGRPPRWLRRWFMSQLGFTRVHPQQGGRESDLFAGV